MWTGTISLIGKNLGQISEEFNYVNVHELVAAITSESWTPARFKERKRTIQTMTAVDLLVLDVDDGCTIAQAAIEFVNYTHVLAPTKSHQKEKNGKICHRFRVIIPLQEVITNDADYKATWENPRQLIDQQTFDHSPFLDLYSL